jgi:hypothetical protein
MADLRYHSTEASNQQDSYGEFQTVDFKMSFLNRKLTGGSIYLLGDSIATNNTTVATNVAYDGFVGSHNLIESITTTSALLGQLENIDNYGRFVSSKAKASLSKSDLFNSIYVCENRVPDDVLASKLLKGVCDKSKQGEATVSAALTKPLDFALKLDFCLNNTIGDNLIPYEVLGDTTISILTSRIIKALYGDAAIGGNITYSLSNLRLFYTTVMDDGKRSKYAMRVKYSLKQAILSSYSSISTKVPLVCNSFWITFMRKAQEDSALYNSMLNQRLPNVSKVEVLWNDSFSQQFTYDINNEEEILTNFIKAITTVVGDNNASLQTLAANDSYGIGINFGQMVDLSKTKLAVNISSAVQSTDPYSAYMFFSGLVEL